MDLARAHMKRHIVIGAQLRRRSSRCEALREDGLCRSLSVTHPGPFFDLFYRAFVPDAERFRPVLNISSRSRSSATVAAAMTAGSFEAMPPTPIGHLKAAKPLSAIPAWRSRLRKRALLAGAADEPDIGETLIAQGPLDDGEIERMAVGHDQKERAFRLPLQARPRGLAHDGSTLAGHGGRKCVGARIDPAYGERQRRQRQDQRAADMARAEKIERIALASDMIRRGIDPGIAYHVGHVLECGALACDPDAIRLPGGRALRRRLCRLRRAGPEPPLHAVLDRRPFALRGKPSAAAVLSRGHPGDGQDGVLRPRTRAPPASATAASCARPSPGPGASSSRARAASAPARCR